MNKIINIVTLILIFFAGYVIGFFKNTKKIIQVYPTLFPPNVVTPAEILSAKEKAKFVVTKFEELQKARNSDVLNMFTPPVSKNEAETYSFLMGYDLSSYDVKNPIPRLFVTAGFAYKVNEYKLNSILETERGYHIEVEEIRSRYNNAPPETEVTDGNVTAGWFNEGRKVYVFEVVQIGINFMVDKYYPKDGIKGKYQEFFY